jgi:hypothetical protein
MDVTLDPQWHRQPGVPAVEAHLDLGRLQRVEHEIHPPASQDRGSTS